jgi:hypothetical protein
MQNYTELNQFDATVAGLQDNVDDLSAANLNAGPAALTNRTRYLYNLINATPRTLYARVNADGSIASGSGLTIVRNSAGRYTVTYSGFSAVPTIHLNPIQGSNQHFVAEDSGQGATTTTTAHIIYFDGNIIPFDAAFCITVTGPR